MARQAGWVGVVFLFPGNRNVQARGREVKPVHGVCVYDVFG